MKFDPILKKLTIFLLVIQFPLLLWLSLDASISGDEFLHSNHANDVVDYFFTLGTNQDALNTPVTNLKYYGQSYDNLASLIGRITKTENIFLLRHLMSAFAGWLIFLFVVLFTSKTDGWRTSFFSILILSLSPVIVGHSINNLKDIPFALGYMSGLFFIYLWIKEWPRPKIKTSILLTIAIAFSISIRPPGLILILFLGIAVFLLLVKEITSKNISSIYNIENPLVQSILITLTGYFAGLVFWPFAIQNPIVNPISAHILMENYPVTIRQLFIGELIWSDMLPWYYLPYMFVITSPVIIIPGLISLIVFARLLIKKPAFLILIFSAVFPLVYIILKDANVYGGTRQVLFVYPPLAIISGYGLTLLFNWLQGLQKKIYLILFTAFLLTLMVHPVIYMAKNHPFHYQYYNQLVGGYKNAFGKFEADYYFNTIHPAAQWLNNQIIENGKDSVKVISNFETKWHFRNNPLIASVKTSSFYNRNMYDWDYAVFSATYLNPITLTTRLWPPPGTIHTIKIDNKPVAVVIKRTSYDDFKGNKALKKGELLNAINLLSKSVNKDPFIEGAWLDYGRALYKIGNFSQAIEKLDSSLSVYPYFEPALLYKARCYNAIGETSESIHTIDFLLKHNPKYLPAYLCKSEILISDNKPNEAIYVLQQALIIQPSFSQAREKLKRLSEKNNFSQ